MKTQIYEYTDLDHYASYLDGKEEDLNKHRENGCSYGQPDGPDDVFKDCDCEDILPYGTKVELNLDSNKDKDSLTYKLGKALDNISEDLENDSDRG